MGKQVRGKLFTITLFSVLLSSSIFAALVPNVHATEITIQQKGITILNDVINLDVTKYNVSLKGYPQYSYQGILPQEHVCYTLKSDESKLKLICTFTDGTLQMIDVI